MKVAYFGYDNVITCLYQLIEKGYDIQGIFTGKPCAANEKIRSCAAQKNITLITEKPDKNLIQKYLEKGVELFLSAEYPWEIPLIEQVKYAINCHPSWLPYAKGKTPLPWILLNHPEYAGLSFHKMTETFDAGDIILQKKINITENETYDTLSARIYILAASLTGELLDNLNQLYIKATPQPDDKSLAEITEQDRTINWGEDTQTILNQIKAFGSLGILATIQQKQVTLIQASGFKENHSFKPGAVIQDNFQNLTIACSDGFIVIQKNSIFNSNL